jgi:predicted SAM-dependent methyltransferase
MLKLNFGCGSIQPKGWWHVDKDYKTFQTLAPEAPIIHDSTSLMADNFFDIIVAHAVVQQFEWHETVKELKELYRILKPGGVIRISLPDIEAGFINFRESNIDWFPNGEEDLHDRFCAWLTWYSTSKTLFTRKAIINKLAEAGFKYIFPVGFMETDRPEYLEAVELDTRDGEFYFIEAQK